jgi:hypothetical protein
MNPQFLRAMRERLDHWIARVVVFLGAPKDESPRFYRDLALSFPFVLCVVGAIFLAAESRFAIRFWVYAGIAAACGGMATKRSVLVGILFGIAAIRFTFAFVVSGRFGMLAVAALCGALALGMATLDKTGYSDSDRIR